MSEQPPPEPATDVRPAGLRLVDATDLRAAVHAHVYATVHALLACDLEPDDPNQLVDDRLAQAHRFAQRAADDAWHSYQPPGKRLS